MQFCHTRGYRMMQLSLRSQIFGKGRVKRSLDTRRYSSVASKPKEMGWNTSGWILVALTKRGIASYHMRSAPCSAGTATLTGAMSTCSTSTALNTRKALIFQAGYIDDATDLLIPLTFPPVGEVKAAVPVQGTSAPDLAKALKPRVDGRYEDSADLVNAITRRDPTTGMLFLIPPTGNKSSLPEAGRDQGRDSGRRHTR